jgi:hypothetical protein
MSSLLVAFVLESVFGAMVIAGSTFSVAAVLRFRVTVWPSGLEVRSLMRTERILWTDVECIDDDNGTAYIVTKEGRRVTMIAVHQYALDGKLDYLRSVHARYR